MMQVRERSLIFQSIWFHRRLRETKAAENKTLLVKLKLCCLRKFEFLQTTRGCIFTEILIINLHLAEIPNSSENDLPQQQVIR